MWPGLVGRAGPGLLRRPRVRCSDCSRAACPVMVTGAAGAAAPVGMPALSLIVTVPGDVPVPDMAVTFSPGGGGDRGDGGHDDLPAAPTTRPPSPA